MRRRDFLAATAASALPLACRRKPEFALPGHPESHPVWRDPQTALRATRRLLALAAECRRVVHVLHVTTAEEMDLLAIHRDLASVEVTPSVPPCAVTSSFAM